MLRVHAQPGASRARIAGLHGDALKVQVRARPVGGAANREILAVLAEALAVRPAALSLAGGESGRAKRIRVAGIDPATARARLAAFVDTGKAGD